MIGVLEEGASYLDTELNSDVVSIDDQIVIPMIYQAKEWGGCYVNHLTFSINDNAVIEKITKKIRQYGFKDYEKMKLSCEKFYNDIDMKAIVRDVLNYSI